MYLVLLFFKQWSSAFHNFSPTIRIDIALTLVRANLSTTYLEHIAYNHTKTKNSHNYPDAFVDKGTFIIDKNEMANKFNEYFVIVGFKLASNIAPPNQRVSVHDYLITKNKSTIFLDPVLYRCCVLRHANI